MHSSSKPRYPRVLLLGPRGSGKTSFLFRLKTGSHFAVSSTTGSNVEEIPVTSKQKLLLSDIGGSDRRNIRLHFLHSVPLTDVSLLFFIDVSAKPTEITTALEDLVYAVTYARNRTGSLHYVGIVLNMQDKLPGEGRLDIVARIRAQAEREIEHLLVSWKREREEAEKDDEAAREQGEDEMDERDGDDREKEGEKDRSGFSNSNGWEKMNWEVLDGGDKGISAKTGNGVEMVFEALCKAVHGIKPVKFGESNSSLSKKTE